MSTHLGFSHFSGFLHHFIMAKLVSSSIRVKPGKTSSATIYRMNQKICIWQSCMQDLIALAAQQYSPDQCHGNDLRDNTYKLNPRAVVKALSWQTERIKMFVLGKASQQSGGCQACTVHVCILKSV